MFKKGSTRTSRHMFLVKSADCHIVPPDVIVNYLMPPPPPPPVPQCVTDLQVQKDLFLETLAQLISQQKTPLETVLALNEIEATLVTVCGEGSCS
jgi:hypothetical protein